MKVTVTLRNGVRVSITTDSATEVGAVLRELGVPGEPTYPERGGDDEPSPEEIRQAFRHSAWEANERAEWLARRNRYVTETSDPAAEDAYVPAADHNGNPRWWHTAETEPPDASAGQRFDASHPTGPGIDGEPPDTSITAARAARFTRCIPRAASGWAVRQPFEPAEVVLPPGRVWPVGTDAWSWERTQADGTLAYGACTDRESAYAAAGLPLPVVPESLPPGRAWQPDNAWFDPGQLAALTLEPAKAAASVSKPAEQPAGPTLPRKESPLAIVGGRESTQDVTECPSLAQGEEITETRLSPPCQDDDALLSAANAVVASDAAISAVPVRDRTTGKSLVDAPGGCVLLYRGSGWSWRCTVPGWQHHSKGGYDTRADALAGVEAWLASTPGENDGGTLDLVDREKARSKIPPGGRLWYQRGDEAYGSRSGWCWELPQAPEGQGVIGVTDGGPHFYYRDALHALWCAADNLGLPVEAVPASRPTADLPPNKPRGGRRKDGQPYKRRKVNVPGDGGTSNETAKQEVAPAFLPATLPPADDNTRRSRTPGYRATRNEGLRKVRETDPLPEVDDLASRLPHRPTDPKLYIHPGAGWGPMEDGGIVKHLVCKGSGCDACNHQGCKRCIEKPPRKWKGFGAI